MAAAAPAPVPVPPSSSTASCPGGWRSDAAGDCQEIAPCERIDCAPESCQTGFLRGDDGNCQPVLDGLAIDGAELSPQFAPLVTEYRVRTPLFQEAANLRASAAFGIAVSVDGMVVPSNAALPHALAYGHNSIEVQVLASGMRRSYHVVVERGGDTTVLEPPGGLGGDNFGHSVSLSHDGNTMVVGASMQDGCNGEAGPNDLSCTNAGAAHVFMRSDGQWGASADLKAASPDAEDRFGYDVAISADGRSVAIGAPGDDGCSTGAGGDPEDDGCKDAGAVHIWTHTAQGWGEPTYLKPANTGVGHGFGREVSLSRDGNLLAVGAINEDGCGTGIDPDPNDAGCIEAGAAYTFERVDGQWTQQAYLKPADSDEGGLFGDDLDLSADGRTLAVGGTWSRAVHVFRHDGSAWSQEALIAEPLGSASSYFGLSVALSDDGNTLVVGSPGGAASTFVYTRGVAGWGPPVRLPGDAFALGFPVAISGAGTRIASGAIEDEGCGTGINPDPLPAGCPFDGAVFLYSLGDAGWTQDAYIKQAERLEGATFGRVALSGDGETLSVGSDFLAEVYCKDEPHPCTESGRVQVF